MIGERDQAARSKNVDITSRPGGFCPTVSRADQALAQRVCRDGRRQSTRYMGNRAVQIELTNNNLRRQGISGDCAKDSHQTQSDRQIKM